MPSPELRARGIQAGMLLLSQIPVIGGFFAPVAHFITATQRAPTIRSRTVALRRIGGIGARLRVTVRTAAELAQGDPRAGRVTALWLDLWGRSPSAPTSGFRRPIATDFFSLVRVVWSRGQPGDPPAPAWWFAPLTNARRQFQARHPRLFADLERSGPLVDRYALQLAREVL